MRPLGPLVCAVAFLTALPFAVGDTPNPTTPAGAVAFLSDENAIVSWAPGSEMPDAFNVYSVVNGSRTLLETTPGTDLKAEVDAPPPSPCIGVDPDGPDVWAGCTGGPFYAVSAMKSGVESPMTAASVVIGVPCIGLDPRFPPDVVVGCMGGLGVI